MSANGESTTNPVDEVSVLLAAARIPAAPDEVAALAAGYPVLRAGVDALYAVPAARDADPALRFRADGATPGRDGPA